MVKPRSDVPGGHGQVDAHPGGLLRHGEPDDVIAPLRLAKRRALHVRPVEPGSVGSLARQGHNAAAGPVRLEAVLQSIARVRRTARADAIAFLATSLASDEECCEGGGNQALEGPQP